MSDGIKTQSLEDAAPSFECGRLIPLRREDMKAEAGYAVTVRLGADFPPGDCLEVPHRSTLRLFEAGKELPVAHAEHEDIRRFGDGRYSHWIDTLYFSARDGSSPLSNGRDYVVLLPGRRREALEVCAEGLVRAEGSEGITRYYALRDAVRAISPEVTLPDYSRRLDQDDAFRGDVRRVCPEGDMSLERKFNLNELVKLALLVDGDIAECGTFNGGSAFFLARRIQEAGSARRLCLFDSFEGLSAPGPDDGSHWHAGQLCGSLETVQKRLADLGAASFTEFFRGWIPDRFAEVARRDFCFVHIDVDLFQPTHDSIAFFYPRMTKGGILLFDDYGYATCPGATKAVDEFMAGKAEPIVNLSAGGAFIIKQ